MSTVSILSMLFNITFIIGGFVYFLLKAMNNEKKKIN